MAVYGRVITATGWTWDYVDREVDLWILNGLYIYWNSHPPTHESVYAILGGFLDEKPKKNSKSKVQASSGRDPRVTKSQAAASELMGAGFRGIQTKAPDWYKPNG